MTGAVTSITRLRRPRPGDRDDRARACSAGCGPTTRSTRTTIKAATKWISQQRGGYGGFGSTQSTILALKALTLHAKKSAHPAESGEIQVLVGGKTIAARQFTEKDVEVIGLDIDEARDGLQAGEKTEVEIVTDAKQAYPFALRYTYTTLTPVSAEKCAVAIGTKLGKAEANEGDTVPLTVTLENKLEEGARHGGGDHRPAGRDEGADRHEAADRPAREGRDQLLRDPRPRTGPLLARAGPRAEDRADGRPGVRRARRRIAGRRAAAYLYYDADHKHWVEPLSIRIAPLAGE